MKFCEKCQSDPAEVKRSLEHDMIIGNEKNESLF